VELPYDTLPAEARVTLLLGGAKVDAQSDASPSVSSVRPVTTGDTAQQERVQRLETFLNRLRAAALSESYEAAHARVVLQSIAVIERRKELLQSGKLAPIEPKASQDAADRSYVEASDRLYAGLERRLKANLDSPDATHRRIAGMWR
jgi:hypothetical protein